MSKQVSWLEQRRLSWGKITFPKYRLVLILPSLKERMIHTGSIEENGESSILHLLLILISFSLIFQVTSRVPHSQHSYFAHPKNASPHAKRFLPLEAVSFMYWYLTGSD